MPQKPLVAIDIESMDGTWGSEGSYRIPDDMVKFLAGLEEHGKIIGFVYDGSYNFRVLVRPRVERGVATGNPLK